MPRFSQVSEHAAEAMSIRYNNLVYDLKRQGKKVIVLSLGEAFFDIPLYPMDELPFPALYHYSHSRGVPELRAQVAAYHAKHHGVSVDPDREIIITAGSKAAIYLAMLCTLDPGDEVIIQEPAWVSYPEQVKYCHGVPVHVPYDKTVFDFEKYLTDKTKLIILNNPNNPVGKVYSPKELQYVVDLAKANDIFVMTDEAYSEFLSHEGFHSLGVFDREKSHTILINSLSKNFGMSGWRLGYVITNPSLTNQILKANQHIVTCPATILEYYVSRYFDRIIEVTKPQIAATVQKRQEVAACLDSIGLKYLPGSTTFYFFVSIAPSRLGSEDFCMHLLKEEHISTVPGVGYGNSCDAFIRVSFGTESMQDIRYALGRIRNLIDQTS